MHYPVLSASRTSPNVSVEDLGTKTIEGFQARGIKTIWLGTEKDGEWNAKPIRALEQWLSDDLGVTLLLINSDFRKATEFQAR